MRLRNTSDHNRVDIDIYFLFDLIFLELNFDIRSTILVYYLKGLRLHIYPCYSCRYVQL